MKIIALLVLLFGSDSVMAQVSTEDAEKMHGQINSLLSQYTDTLVLPTEGKEAVIICSTKVLATDQIKKLWSFLSACAVGNLLNDNPNVSIAEIWLTDRADMAQNPPRYSVVSTSIAKEVQAKVHAEEMTLEDGIEKIWASLQQRAVAKE